MDAIVVILGLAINKARLKAKLTQKELADEVGVSRVTINKLENGTVQGISFATVAKIAIILDLSLDSFIKVKNRKKS